MRKAFKASRLIGLLALLAGFMAVSATAAQAEGTWLNNAGVISEPIGISAEAETEGVLLTKVGVSKVEILCPKIKFAAGTVLTTTGGGTGSIHFEECITKLNGTTAAKCAPHSTGAAAGLIETFKLDGSQRLSGGVQYFELLPEAGTIFVDLLLGAECAIGNLIEITGKVWLKDCEGKGLIDLVRHLFEEEPALSSLLFGGNKATIDGSAWAFLNGANVGHTFAGHV